MANRHGNNVVAEMSDALVIGYSGAEKDTSSMGYIGGQTGGQLWLRVYAATDISIASGESWYIEFQSFSANTVGSAIMPFSNSNSGGINQATGTSMIYGHLYMFHKTSADSTAATWSAGDLITEMAIPEKLCRLLEHDYVNVMNTTDKTDPGVDETIDVLLCVNPS